MSEPKRKSGPTYYIFAGLVILALGLIVNDGSGISGAVIALGLVVAVCGVIAKAVEIGVRSGRRD